MIETRISGGGCGGEEARERVPCSGYLVQACLNDIEVDRLNPAGESGQFLAPCLLSLSLSLSLSASCGPACVALPAGTPGNTTRRELHARAGVAGPRPHVHYPPRTVRALHPDSSTVPQVQGRHLMPVRPAYSRPRGDHAGGSHFKSDPPIRIHDVGRSARCSLNRDGRWREVTYPRVR